MSFQEEKKNSVFLQNFQKRLFQFFQKSQDLKTTSLEEGTSSFSTFEENPRSNLEDLKNSSNSMGVNTSSFSSNVNPVQNSSKSTPVLKTNVVRNSSATKTVPSNLRNGTKPTVNRASRFQENTKQQVVSITYEEIGLFPRSFNRVFDRFFKQLFFDVENLVIQEYRFYRYLFLTTVKCVFILVFVPLTINFLAKNYLVRPITEHYWNSHQPEIFLNSYQQRRAFNELQDFEEKIYFESLVLTNPTKTRSLQMSANLAQNTNFIEDETSPVLNTNSLTTSTFSFQHAYAPEFFSDSVQNRLHEKILELAVHYNEESIEAITNFFADLMSFTSLCYLFITKSFLLEVFFGLDDSKKSLFILFLTDLLVGYHSPNIWELFFSSFFDHYGLPENQTTIFLLVATLPVLLDVLFKYLIFRHLNRASPATVATYHAMIE
jgi:hypothetical protein